MTTSRVTAPLISFVLLAGILGVVSSRGAHPALPDASLALVRGSDTATSSTGAKIDCDDNLPVVAGQITYRACAALPNAQAVGQACIRCEIETGSPTYANDTGAINLTHLYDIDCTGSFQHLGTCIPSANPKTTGYCRLANQTNKACIGAVKWYKVEVITGTGGGP